ncbi:MAG: hypothetical protein NWQ28_10105, partial [Nodularia sp. (in: cyanobacteria)]|nr:hypothetical protein [Nodularia sp. (in: cyanobacteria)]
MRSLLQKLPSKAILLRFANESRAPVAPPLKDTKIRQLYPNSLTRVSNIPEYTLIYLIYLLNFYMNFDVVLTYKIFIAIH